jgi:hypothetical protein
MSFQAMTWALRQKTGNPTAKAILLALANYADDEGSCFPGQERLAEECECSVRTIQRQMEYLESKGFLRRSRRADGRGARTSDRYFLLLHDKLSPDTDDEPTRQIVGASKDEPTRRNTSLKKPERTDASLVELRKVLDEKRAQAVLDHRKRLGKSLTPHAANLLAKRLGECPDPNAAADEMICNGWQGFKPDWLDAKRRRSAPRKAGAEDRPKRALEGKTRANSVPASNDRVMVSLVDDYRLFRRCEQLVGKEGLRDKTGTCWWFPPNVVDRARQELGARAHG